MSLLAIQGLSLRVGALPILSDVSLTVAPGEIVGLIGESGSGKSMTALSVMQLLPRGFAAEGSIGLDGVELLGRSDKDMCAMRGRDIAMVFQEPMTALNPVKTIGEQVAETVLVHGEADHAGAMRVARETLERVGLPTTQFPLERYPHELSGGQRQRVVIAMAIALRPRLLLADEPTTALDVTTQGQILDLLKGLVADFGMGLLFITHDMAVVAELAARVYIMRKGVVVESGETLQLFRSMQHPYTRSLFEASRHVPARVAPSGRGNAMPVLKVDRVVRDYVLRRQSVFSRGRHFRAVDDVAFIIQKGENVGLVGESGCGKSTLARAIMALETVQSGEIRIDGELVTGERGASFAGRRKMQIVFQDPYGSFNPRHRVERLVAEPFHLLGADAPRGAQREKKVHEALDMVGLSPSDAEKYSHEFSGGQRQRIAIARALIIRPALIVLDEAVSALDVRVRAQILDLLADLSARLHLSYLFIAHDLAVVRAITDRVLVMKAGRIVEHGVTEDVFRNPAHPYTRELIAATPSIEQAIARRQAHQAVNADTKASK